MVIKNRKVLSIAALAALALLWLGTTRALFECIVDLNSEIALRKRALAKQKGILAKRDLFLTRYEEMKNQLSQTKEPDERLNYFVNQLELWAKEEALVLEDVRPLPSEEEQNITFLKVALELEGEMLNVGRFLYKISSSKEPLRIERFSIFQKVRMSRQIHLDIELSFLYLE